MSTPGAVWVLLASLIWGTTGLAATYAPDVSPLAIGAAAMGLGGLLQAAVAWSGIRRSRAALWRHRRRVLLSGLAVAVYPLAFYSSMRWAGVAVGTVVSLGTAPAFAALAERVLDRHPLSRRWFVATALGLVGMVALSFGRHDGAGEAIGWGLAAGVVAGATYAWYARGAALLIVSGVPSRTAMGAVFGVGGVLLLPVLLVTGGPILDTSSSLLAVAYLALVPMFGGYVLFGIGLRTVTASTATSITLVEPAAATVLAVLVLRETLPPAGWAGVALLLAGLVVTATGRRPAPGTRGTDG